MNTRSGQAAYLKKEKDYVFCNEELELAFEKNDLEIITAKWNQGHDMENIAKEHKRDPDEIFLAIFHQAREGKVSRRINQIAPIKHIKIKKNVATVIEYKDRRYVYEPKKTRR